MAVRLATAPWFCEACSSRGLFPVMEMVRNVYSGGVFSLARASAQGTILMLIIILVTLVQFVVRRKKT